LRLQYGRIRFLEFTPDALRRPSSPGNSVLGDRGENLSSVLKAICDDPKLKHSLTSWLEELTPLDVVDLEFPSDLQGRILATLVEQSGRKTPATSASDGTLRFLGLLAALLHPEPAACYFLEEFDTGIHPSRLYLLVQLIEQETARSGVQVIVTTHSPQVLEMLNDKSREDAVLVYRLPHSDHSQIKRIMEIPTAREVLKTAPLGELHQTGWLENTVYFGEPETEPETAS
jgi:predicted ATPase